MRKTKPNLFTCGETCGVIRNFIRTCENPREETLQGPISANHDLSIKSVLGARMRSLCCAHTARSHAIAIRDRLRSPAMRFDTGRPRPAPCAATMASSATKSGEQPTPTATREPVSTVSSTEAIGAGHDQPIGIELCH